MCEGTEWNEGFGKPKPSASGLTLHDEARSFHAMI
jgi:hypothetical protein